MITKSVPLSKIKLVEAFRPTLHNPLLVKSMKKIGLTTPVTLYWHGNAYRVLDGQCRVYAARLLGWESIMATTGKIRHPTMMPGWERGS
jgi:hypothetical protein